MSETIFVLGGMWEYVRTAFGSELGAIIGGAIFTFLCLVIGFGYRLVQKLLAYTSRLQKVRSDVSRKKIDGYWKEGEGLWLSKPVHAPDIALLPSKSTPKVLIVANAKGGVGKTTVAANIAARFAELAEQATPSQKPVLLIDLDFQGTLSAMAIATQTGWLPGAEKDSDATYLISGDWNSARIASIDQTAISLIHGHARSISQLKIVKAYYDLAQAENREMIHWLVSDRKTDIRFRLRELLWSNEILNSYSMVIIDCPPRFTTAAVQAIAAATHVLIPTKLDSPSADAVVTFGRQIEILRAGGVCPNIDYIGVVATMVRGSVNYAQARRSLSDKLARSWVDGGLAGKTVCLPPDVDIPESTAFADAADRGIAYNVCGNGERERALKEQIRRLACTVAVRMHLPPAFQGIETDATPPVPTVA